MAYEWMYITFLSQPETHYRSSQLGVFSDDIFGTIQGAKFANRSCAQRIQVELDTN